jgi:translation initiation factor 1
MRGAGRLLTVVWMSKKTKPDSRGFVYSTDPNFSFEPEPDHNETLPPAQQRLKLKLDTRNRAGNAVTLVEGFVGQDDDLQELGKKLKSFCGTGGSAKDRLIIVQGDQREKLLLWLLKNGYKLTKKN